MDSKAWNVSAASTMALYACAHPQRVRRASGIPESALYLAYDVVFGTLPSWGTVGEVRNDIDFETEVLPKLIAEVSSPANFPKFEFVRLVAGNRGRGITPPPPPAFPGLGVY